MIDTDTLVCRVWGKQPQDDRYRALWRFLFDSGLDDEIIQDPAALRAYYDHGGYPYRLISLDPTDSEVAAQVQATYHLPPSTDWNTRIAVIADDPNSLTLWDPVTDHQFFVVR